MNFLHYTFLHYWHHKEEETVGLELLWFEFYEVGITCPESLPCHLCPHRFVALGLWGLFRRRPALFELGFKRFVDLGPTVLLRNLSAWCCVNSNKAFRFLGTVFWRSLYGSLPQCSSYFLFEKHLNNNYCWKKYFIRKIQKLIGTLLPTTFFSFIRLHSLFSRINKAVFITISTN